ncbi:MAG: glycolate oxidase subunit GlcF [Steroidobacteraceae bacterium]
METRLAGFIRDSTAGRTADEILRACVHCGFCLATCPTYQVLGDELDSPRGRIYQIKQVLEGAEPSRATQIHLDRCLTCRACETTCPSGVEYGHLVDIGRAVVDARVRRPWRERLQRWVLREGLTRPWLFGAALRAARCMPWALPMRLRAKVGVKQPAGAWPARQHARKVLLLKGCTQPAISPAIDAATARVLDAIGVQTVVAARAGCCGALRHHLDDQAGARGEIYRNIDAWWPYIESGEVEAILINASGCGAMVREYAHILRDDPAYSGKARRVVQMSKDPAEFLPSELGKLGTLLESAAVPARPEPVQAGLPAAGSTSAPHRVAFHPPCTLQHGLKIRGAVEKLLVALGAELVPVADAHLCCGSAGPYSLVQPQMAETLRGRKLDTLLQHGPDMVLSANIGCIAHLQGATDIPVRHWIEWVDQRFAPTWPS